MQQIVDFILELDKLKGVARKVRPIGLDRYENPAEHSWRIAPMAASLAQYAESPIDISRAIAMLLVHDIGEIDAGDTAESRFAHSIARAMPVLLNLSNRGQRRRENGISCERVVRGAETEVKAGRRALWDYVRGRLEDVRHRGFFGA